MSSNAKLDYPSQSVAGKTNMSKESNLMPKNQTELMNRRYWHSPCKKTNKLIKRKVLKIFVSKQSTAKFVSANCIMLTYRAFGKD